MPGGPVRKDPFSHTAGETLKGAGTLVNHDSRIKPLLLLKLFLEGE